VQAQLVTARRNQILDAATSVFAEHGFHRATIKDVAKAAGIADGTIYIYFENKTALLLGILDRLNESENREAQFEQAEQIGLRQWVREYIAQRLEALDPATQQVFRVLLPEILVNEEIREKYLQQIIQPTFEIAERFSRRWIADGTLRSVDPVLTQRAVAGMVLGVLVLRLIGEPQVAARWNELPGVVADILLNGLSQEQSHE
jgi:AcrR family transcriptional regulator